MLQRLALAYAPGDARLVTLGLLALDSRLASVVRDASEPMLAQIRLAWWREMFAQPQEQWPEGEPLVALLSLWKGHVTALSGLVDGWEEMTAPAPLAGSAMELLADKRADAFAALAVLVGEAGSEDATHRMGRAWAVADLVMHLNDPAERDVALELAQREGRSLARLPRKLRPLAVLHGVARRRIGRPEIDKATRGEFFAAMRIGLLGY